MVVGDPTVSLKQSAFVSVGSLGKEDRQSPPIRELVANASPLLGKVIVCGHDVQDSILHECSITSAVEDVKHGGEKKLISGPDDIPNDTVLNDAVVSAVSQHHKLESLTVGALPLDDVFVIGADSALGSLLSEVHGSHYIRRCRG